MTGRVDESVIYDHAWRKARAAVLGAADGSGRYCAIRGPNCTRLATQVDHIVPVGAGGARLDPANLRPACATCNIGRAAREKAAEGWKRSRTRIVLIIGPPAAGKSTYARARAGARDLIVDYDEISAALGPELPRGASQRHDAVMAMRNALLRKVRRGEVDADVVWLISTNPAAETMFPHHEVVTVDPGVDVVLAQAAAAGRPASMTPVIRRWYAAREHAGDDARTAAPSREW